MTVRVAIVGCGIAGRARARAVHAHPETELVAVHRGRYAAELGAPVVDAEAVLQDVDVVVVSSPSDTHEDWVRRALDAGLDVICEYPLARTPEAAQALFARARTAGQLLHVEHIELLASTTRWLADAVGEHGWRAARVCFRSRGEPYLDGDEHAWWQISRLHRIVAVFGWPSTVATSEASGSTIRATLVWPDDRTIAFEAHRGPGLARGLHMTAETAGGRFAIVGRDAERDGMPIDLPRPALFSQDLDHALRQRRGEARPYLSEGRLVRVAALATLLGSVGVSDVSAKTA